MDDVTKHMQALERFKDLLKLSDLLIGDVKDAVMIIDINIPSRQRNYVRTVFAMIEGALNVMCRIIFEAKDLDRWKLSEEEIDTIADSISFFKQDTAKKKKKKSFKPLSERIKVAFKISNRLLKEDCNMDFAGKDWDNFKKTMQIRNRLSHPKTSNDLEITKEEIRLTDLTRDWFRFGVEKFIMAFMKYRERKIQALKKKKQFSLNSPQRSQRAQR